MTTITLKWYLWWCWKKTVDWKKSWDW